MGPLGWSTAAVDRLSCIWRAGSLCFCAALVPEALLSWAADAAAVSFLHKTPHRCSFYHHQCNEVFTMFYCPCMVACAAQAKDVLMALYFAADHVVWAHQIGLLQDKRTGERAQKVSLYSWALGSVATMVLEANTILLVSSCRTAWLTDLGNAQVHFCTCRCPDAWKLTL